MPLIAATSFRDRLDDFFDSVGDFAPKLVGALTILLVGWIIARIIRFLAGQVLNKVKFGELVEKAGLSHGLTQAGYPDASAFVAKLLYYIILLIALQLAINVFGETQIGELLNSFIAILPLIVIAIIIIVITGVVANAVRSLLAPMLASASGGDLALKFAVGAIWVIGIFAAIDVVGVAETITETLFQVVVGSVGLILVIKFGVGGIWAARDRFWPSVYDKLTEGVDEVAASDDDD